MASWDELDLGDEGAVEEWVREHQAMSSSDLSDVLDVGMAGHLIADAYRRGQHNPDPTTASALYDKGRADGEAQPDFGERRTDWWPEVAGWYWIQTGDDPPFAVRFFESDRDMVFEESPGAGVCVSRRTVFPRGLAIWSNPIRLPEVKP